MVPLLFSPGEHPKGCHILIYLTTEPFSTLPQSLLNEFQAREDGSISGSCLHMASSLHEGGFNQHLWTAWQTESVPEPMQ